MSGRPNNPEELEQRALVEWADKVRVEGPPLLKYPMVGDYLYAVPNGGWRKRTEAARLKGQGVRPGVPDLVLAIPSRGYSGMYIELKPTPYGSYRPTTTERQDEWLAKLAAAGYYAIKAVGWDAARREIVWYLEMVNESRD